MYKLSQDIVKPRPCFEVEIAYDGEYGEYLCCESYDDDHKVIRVCSKHLKEIAAALDAEEMGDINSG